MTSWLLEFVKGCAPLKYKLRRRGEIKNYE
jgi:hypothetical protein